ncbi:uncharacterized protein [Antennarius striatus]|uniref:uncharacterized protein n=1 Tax=Antennarius striatus TaxID=241820 RepID=UPI0035B19510
MTKGDSLESGNLWLNDTALKDIREEGKVSSLTVSPDVENKLTFLYKGSTQEWHFRITPSTNTIRIRGLQRPLQQPTNATKAFLEMMSPTEVFTCENGTSFFYQNENIFLAVGHTTRLPVKLQSSSTSMLLISWVPSAVGISSHTTTLYNTIQHAYLRVSRNTTTNSHYNFTALDPCSPYVACVEMAAGHSLTCLSAITDPDIPLNFRVTSWNSSSIFLAWDCPENCRFSMFLLTAFYLNGTDHITEEVPLWHTGEDLTFVLSELQPCSRVKFGLQTFCQAGTDSRYSRMVTTDGNSAHSSIEALCQTSFGPNNYTLSWDTKTTSSISMFRLYHEGALQGTTLLTNYTVQGLLPCRPYQARVEALCGDSVIMSVKTITAHTGPHGVSELRYRSNDSTALWLPSNTHHPAMAFLYELSLENGRQFQRSRVTDPELYLPGLEDGKTYVLDVWEECGGQWTSQRSHMCFEATNSSLKFFGRAAETGQENELFFDISSLGLTLVVPWSLPEDLQDELSEPRAVLEKIVKDKLQDLLEGFGPPVRIEVTSLVPADEPDKTEILFMSFDASQTEGVPLPAEDQLDYIRSLNATDVFVTDRVIHWNGPDLCTSPQQPLCPRNSLCINSLGSYLCVCQHGYYDVSSIIESPAASRPVCNENGLFSLCLDKLLTGGIAKPYLASLMEGKFDVRLNDGKCSVHDSDVFYYFRASRKASECGTERHVTKTHIEFRNTLSVTLNEEQTISRRDLKVVWKCVYPRHYVRNTSVSVDMTWLTTLSLMEVSSSLQLGLTMFLFTNLSYTHSYSHGVSLEPEDTLFLQVALLTNNSFASDVLLRVESCWATESIDPQDTVQGVLLQDGCPVDNTFHWLSVNGQAQHSRFSIQMFRMPNKLPFYIHCLTSICGHNEDCVKSCTSKWRSRRSANQKGEQETGSAVVSAGPVVVHKRGASRNPPSHWPEYMTVVFIVAGSIGFLVMTALTMRAAKAIMTYYERLRRQ